MEPWMMISLSPPPVQTNKITENIDVKGLRHACDNSIRVLSKQSPLHREGALLSRFVYKYDKKFRNDVGYRHIRKINTALHKYLQLDLLKAVENFTAVLPNEDDDCLPTRQMLEFVLLRIISFSKLMLRVYVCSKQAAVFYLDRVKRGESHWMSLMPYSLLSRIWSMSTILLQHSTSWYSCLYPYLSVLQPKGLKFLIEGYELPKDLDDWLDLKNLDTFGKLNWSQKITVNVGLGLYDDEEVNSFTNILEYANLVNEEVEEMDTDEYNSKVLKIGVVQDQLLNVSFNTNNDLGQAVSRENFKVISSTHETKQDIKNTISQESCKVLTSFQRKISNENKCSHYFGKVKTAKSLKEFLDKEEFLRNDGNNQSLTKHLSFMQWHTLKTSLLKVCELILNNKRIEKKLQKVWKEKCLDYM